MGGGGGEGGGGGGGEKQDINIRTSAYITEKYVCIKILILTILNVVNNKQNP